ncbi:MAG: alpha/beta hydrolase [Hyphomicrobiaceae bacterium]|nr:MAG: alpha/beta hydrolase [Hyphomicrobiaceae bacterium]
MRQFRGVCFAALFVALLPAGWSDSQAQGGCGRGPTAFAHCEANARNFQTVLLAVHGWNGDCASTFGSENQSIFKVIDEPFYDMDCFQYDSKKTALDRNVELLHERLTELHAKGYRQVILVTHSTGGILALRLLTRVSLGAGGLASAQNTWPLQSTDAGGLRLKAIHAWATPINGLRSWVATVGGVATYLFSPETLPDLKPGSAYLTALQADLKTLSGLLDAADGSTRARLQVPIVFYQGQSEDGIVLNIDQNAAIAAGWWPYGAKIVNTESGHTHNIGAGGTIGTPKYPAKLMEVQALLDLSLMPRLDEVFPRNISSVPGTLETRQLVVVDGISAYAHYLFLQAYTPLADFLKRLVADAFPRSQNVDDRIMRKLARSVEDATLGTMTRDLAIFCDRLVTEVFAGYQTGTANDPTRFGEGRSAVAQNIVKMLNVIRQRVNEFLASNPAETAAALPYSGSLENFNANVLKLNARVLVSRFDPARTDALKALTDSIGQYTAAEIKKAEFDKEINKFSMTNYRVLSAEDRGLVSKIYGGIFDKESSVSVPTLDFLNRQVRWLNDDRPLWTAVLEKDVIEKVVRNEQIHNSPAKFTFTTGVIKQSGVIVNTVPVSKEAVKEAHRMVVDPPQPELKSERQKQFLDAGRTSRYPAIRGEVERLGAAAQQ